MTIFKSHTHMGSSILIVIPIRFNTSYYTVSSVFTAFPFSTCHLCVELCSPVQPLELFPAQKTRMIGAFTSPHSNHNLWSQLPSQLACIVIPPPSPCKSAGESAGERRMRLQESLFYSNWCIFVPPPLLHKEAGLVVNVHATQITKEVWLSYFSSCNFILQ